MLQLCFLSPANVVCEGYVFTGVCLSTGDVRDRGWACMTGGAWVVGACLAGGCVAEGRACVAGGMHGGGQMCGSEACVVGGHAWPHPPSTRQHYKIRSVNARAVRILLECILVPNFILFSSSSSDYLDCLLASTELTCGPHQAKTGEKEKSIKEQTANIKEKFHFRVRIRSV